jgi:hypothetical protein
VMAPAKKLEPLLRSLRGVPGRSNAPNGSPIPNDGPTVPSRGPDRPRR